MPVYNNSTRIINQIDSDPLTWLLANIGEEVTIEYDISVKTFSLNSTTSTWILNNQDGYLGTTWITGGDFSMFDVGDEIQIVNYVTNTLNGNAFIVEKLSNSEIRLDSNPAGWGANSTGSQDVISLVLPVTAFRYKWNLIENSDPINYNSKIDGTEQLVSITGLDVNTPTSNIPMTFLGSPCYQIGNVEIDVIGLDNLPVYSSNFIIRHTTRITPLFLQFQFEDYLNNIKPLYYDNTKCLKQVAFFEARYNNTNPNAIETLRVDNVLGNTGFFDENFNTGLTNYRVENLSYIDSSPTPVVIPSVQLKISNNTNFSFDIVNTVDSPFDASGSFFLILNFAKCPNDETEYKNNGRDVIHNFVWDKVAVRVLTTPTPKDGDNYGTAELQSLKAVKATYVSASKITITGKIEFLQDGLDVFNESNEPRYTMFVSLQDYTKTGATSDRVCLNVDASPFYFQTLYPNLLNISSKLIPHELNDYASSFTQRDTFSEDELVGFSLITINEIEKENLNLLITRITSKVIARNTLFPSKGEFVLDYASFNTSGVPLNGNYQYFNLAQPRIFHVPTTEIRKNFIARFNTVTGRYEVAFPFLNRWEYWIRLAGVNSDFFNVNQPNTGENHDWVHYFTAGGWTLSYVTEVAMKVDGVPQNFTSYTDYEIYDRNLEDENITCTIKTYDGATELVDGGGQKYILGYKNTLVEATFTDTVNDLDIGTEKIVIGIEVFEEGGVSGKRRMSSEWASDSDTWFLPLTAGDKVSLTQISANALKGSAYIDFTQLDTLKLNWKLTARLYLGSERSLSPSIGITDGYGYLGSQNVKLIKDNPIDATPQPVTPKDMDCCGDFIWRVLAHSTDNNDLYNDKKDFLFWFDKNAVTTATMYLVASDGTEYDLTGISTYGIPYDYGFIENNQNQKLVGYLIEWRKVLLTLGEDVYYVRCDIETVFGGEDSKISKTYCLKQYTEARANGTVRVEYYLNGILGINENDEKVRDLVDLNWYGQHRFDGFFAFNKGAYESTYIQYANGLNEWVEDKQNPEYLLKLKPIPMFKHDVLRTDILQSDAMYITDYNTKNIDTYYRKRVQKISGYEPVWNYLQTKLAPVDIRFKQAINNNQKFRE